MANYTKTTDFAAKDTLPGGDTNKVVRGSEFETEFDAISTAIATKSDTASPTFTGTVTIPTADINGGNIDGTVIGASTAAAGTFTNLTATGTVDFSSGNVTTNIDGGTIDNAVIGGSTPAAGTFTTVAGTTATFSAGVSGTTGTFSGAVSGTTGTFSGAVTGSNLNVSNWDTAFGWGNHASAGYLTSVGFSDIAAGAVTTSSETFSDVDNQIPTNAAVIDYVAATIPSLSVTEASVTQHEAALSIAATQLTGNITVPGNVYLAPSGTGYTELRGNTNAGAIRFNCESNSHGVTLKGPPHSAAATYTLELPNADGTNGQFLKTDGSGKLSFGTVDVSTKVDENHTGDVNITGELLVDSYNETFKKVTSSSNATTVNCENANVFEHVLTENTTFTFSNPPASGTPVVTNYDIANASYDSKEASTASQEIIPTDLFLKPDGTILYVIGTNNDTVYQYTLSTANDISTASYASKSFSVSQEGTPQGLYFKSDGTKMYVVGATNDTVYQYSLSTAWDVSTASYDSKNVSVSSQENDPHGLEFKPDGTAMYVIGFTNDTVYQYTLSTAWDVSTASYASKSFDAGTQMTSPSGMRFNSDGTKMFILDSGNVRDLAQYSLSTAYDVSTASYDSVKYDTDSENTAGSSQQGLHFSSDGSKFFTVDRDVDKVFQYSASSSSLNDSTAYAMSLKIVQDSGASGYTVTWPTSVDWPSATAPTLTATASAVDQFVFYTFDGGTNWYGFTAGQALG